MKPSLFEIFKLYFIIGLQLIGGGYVIYPLLKKYLIEDKNLLTEDELTDYLTISQCLPGIIALNVSIFSGYKLRKIKGAIIAVLGLLLPAFLIILLLANIILTYQENQIVKYFMFGVRLSIIVLITSMLYDIFKKIINSKFSIFIFLLILFASLYANISPTFLIIIAIVISFLKGVNND